MKNVRIGVIGTGRIGRLHTTNLVRHVDGAEVVGVADPLVSEAEPWLTELGISERYSEHRQLLEREDVDAVYVCSSTDTHADIVIEAAQAGKQIFCEKPIDLTVRKVKEALQAVRAAGVKLQVGFNRRFDHDFATLRERVAEGAVGDVHIVRIASRDPKAPPAGYVARSGGLFLDMTIHDFDMAEFVSGSRVVEVSAAGAVLVDPEIGEAGDIDTAIVTLRLENGALGVIDNSRQAVYGYDQRVEVFGSKGMLMAENETGDSLRHLGVGAETRTPPLWYFLERFTQAFVEESRAFVTAVREDTEVPVDGDAGLRPILIALAANKSLAEGRTVRVEEIDG